MAANASSLSPQGKATARRLWLWPVAILLSLPIGGYIADLAVNGVDSVGLVGQRKLSVTADVYTHVLSDGRELDYAHVLA
jgi:hypothetical protein